VNGAEALVAEILGAVIVLAVLGCLAVAQGWVAVSLSIRTIPRSKRQRRTAAAAPVPAPEPAATPLRGAA